ncbi:glycoprotein [Proteus mirabilis]
MTKYEVIIPWHGVEKGQVIELENLHPAFKANVRALSNDAAELVPATPKAKSKKTKMNSRESGFFMPSKGGFAL